MIIFEMNTDTDTDTNTVPILKALCRIFQKYFEQKISKTNISSKNLKTCFTFIEQHHIKNCEQSPKWDNLLSLVTFNISYVNSVSLLRITYNNPKMLEYSVSGYYSGIFSTEIKTNIVNPKHEEIEELSEIIQKLQGMFNIIMPSNITPSAQVITLTQ